jgi:hypothetical protein
MIFNKIQASRSGFSMPLPSYLAFKDETSSWGSAHPQAPSDHTWQASYEELEGVEILVLLIYGGIIHLEGTI